MLFLKEMTDLVRKRPIPGDITRAEDLISPACLCVGISGLKCRQVAVDIG
jgi:hypothetical protein